MVTLSASSGAAGRHMPPGSFLKQSERDVRSLTTQVQTNKNITERYARLFHLSTEQVSLVMRRLHLTRLPHDKVLDVYYVHPGEQIGYKTRRVKQGTEVWAFADGTPALMEICGNPLRESLGAFAEAPGSRKPIPTFRPYEPLGGLIATVPDQSLDLRPPKSQIPTEIAANAPTPVLASIPSVPDALTLPFGPGAAGGGPGAAEAGGGSLFAKILAALAAGLGAGSRALANTTDRIQPDTDALSKGAIPTTPPGETVKHKGNDGETTVKTWTNGGGKPFTPDTPNTPDTPDKPTPPDSPTTPTTPWEPTTPVTPCGPTVPGFPTAVNHPTDVPEPGPLALIPAFATAFTSLARKRRSS